MHSNWPASIAEAKFSQMLKYVFPEESFLRNNVGAFPQVCTFEGKLCYSWALNAAAEKFFGFSAADLSPKLIPNLPFFSFGYVCNDSRPLVELHPFFFQAVPSQGSGTYA